MSYLISNCPAYKFLTGRPSSRPPGIESRQCVKTRVMGKKIEKTPGESIPSSQNALVTHTPPEGGP
ncbi:hypothetical protein OH77DRAFT_1419852 [Trametes cingulata]|nr:hypothetical protein OH77DRAFT_1419852 [Trametes cingulata]